MFQHTLNTLCYYKQEQSRTGTIINDELIEPRASDVEQRNHSQRKAPGKDGTSADFFGCSHTTGILYRMQLRNSGENEEENVATLFGRLPSLNSQNHDIS